MTWRTEHLADGVTLYCGDCREILPTLGKFDACVTDPPYGIGRDGQAKTTGGNGGRKAYTFKGWDQSRPGKDVFDIIRSVTDEQVIWGGNYFADYLPATGKWLVWDKGQRINQSDGELAYTSKDGALRIFTKNRVALLVEGAVHPTQKPIEIMVWSIQQLSGCQTILDPFMGSGSTGVAAVKLGLSFVGIEVDREFFDIACRRIQAALDAPDMFVEPPKPAKQEAML